MNRTGNAARQGLRGAKSSGSLWIFWPHGPHPYLHTNPDPASRPAFPIPIPIPSHL